MSKPIVLAGALDTKSPDYDFVRRLIMDQGVATILVDFGVLGEPSIPVDIDNATVARAGGKSLDDLRATQDKTEAMRVMSAGLAAIVSELNQRGELGGILALAGSGGTAIATAAMRALPVGVPKLMVSTVAAGDIAPYVAERDITMMPAVVDVAGVNRISRRIYANAANAIIGMVQRETPASGEEKPLITASMFGNTTPCITHAKSLLEQQGFEVLVFHATGAGGRTMETLLADGYAAGNLDLTTTELADEVCGGFLSAGTERLMAAARRGVPTVLAPGCVDMANFWALGTVPERYRGRTLYEWNPNVTLMRTNADENRRIGEMIARAANASVGPTTILLPLKGVSQLDSPGGAFWDPEADAACYEAIKANLRPGIPVVELDCNINDLFFAATAVECLLAQM